MEYPAPRRAAEAVAVLTPLAFLASCSELLHDAPDARPGTPLALELVLPAAVDAPGAEEAYAHTETARVVLTRGTFAVVDTAFPFSPEASETEVFLEVELESEAEQMGLTVELEGGGFPLFRAEESVELRRGRETSVVADLEGVVGSPSPALDVAAGSRITCAVNTVGQAFCWGRDEMTIFVEEPTARPTPVPLPMWPRFVRVTAGDYHACGLTPEGEAYCWGWNVQGQLGDGTTTDRLVPTPVAGGHTFSSIEAGAYHVCGLEGGTALCWGGNGRVNVDDAGGPLGFTPPEVCPVGDSYFGDVLCSTVPRPVEGGLAFASVTGGGFHSCGATTGGEGYCWGWNVIQQIGVGPDTTYAFPFPQRVAMEGPVAEVHAGGIFSCGRTTSGAVECWGNIFLTSDGAPSSSVWDWGQLGDGAFDGNAGPEPVTGGHTFTDIALPSANSIFAGYTCGLEGAGTAYCWGINDRGQLGAPGGQTCSLGDTSFDCRSTPAPVSGGHTFTKLSLGENHACGVATDGTLYCWGGNGLGQLGDGTTADRPTPTAVVAPSPAG